ncbi:hypothetical protein OsI_36460 [Oryza sativa Indica Group]|uniref:Uncharacterized protein n=1 Tax=Oryza sativa subsp. indica TaxID=39946 RepID=A2ZF96_ORYSI|nr:hypothetical protein OsI_36460 [Oryza sativa Indica Group]
MLGFSTGQLVVILGACSLMMKRSDMIKIARVAGRMTGRAVGRLMLFRRQMDEVLEQTAAKQWIYEFSGIGVPSDPPFLGEVLGFGEFLEPHAALIVLGKKDLDCHHLKLASLSFPPNWSEA